MGRLELSHAVKESQEDGRSVVGRINPLVAQFAQEAAVAPVDGLIHDAEVGEGIIEHIAVDVVDDFSSGAVRDADEGAYHQIVAVAVAVVAHLGVRFFVRGEVALAVGRVAVSEPRTGFVQKEPVGVCEEHSSIGHFRRNQFDDWNHCHL